MLQRGIDENQLRIRLLEKGIDVDSMTPEQILAAQSTIETTIREIESDQTSEVADQRTTGAPPRDKNNGFARSARDTLPIEAKARADTLANRARAAGSTDEEFAAELAILQSQERAAAKAAQKSRIYGHDIFTDGSLSVFRTAENVEVPDSYRIGVGDQLAVNIFGASQVDFLLRVDNEGFISPGNLQKIYVRGLSIGQARELVRGRLQQYYVFGSGQFNFSLDGSRTIRVNVFGEVRQSGTYTLSAVNGALNSLVAAGGVSEIGTVRRIQRNRGGESVTIDVYAYLTNPAAVTDDLSLQNNDIVFVPLAGDLVTLNGAVKRPMQYELLDDEGLRELLRYGGGYEVGAFPDLIQVRRLVAGVPTVIDVPAADIERGGGFDLINGDVVTVRSLSSQEASEVTVEGAVDLPGAFAFREGLTVDDLLNQARLRGDARLDVAYLRRSNPDSTVSIREVSLEGNRARIQLERGDELQVLSLSQFQDRAHVAVTGAVRDPIPTFPFSSTEPLTVRDALLQAGGTTPNASNRGVLFRRVTVDDPQLRFEYVDLEGDGENIVLQPYDSLVIYPREYLERQFTVSLLGAVQRPGDYKYDPSLGFRELLTLGGGFAVGADRQRVEIFRLDFAGAETRTLQGSLSLDSAFMLIGGSGAFGTLQPFDVIVVRTMANFSAIRTVTVQGEVRYPGPYPILDEQSRVADFIRAAGGVTSQAFPAGSTLLRVASDVGFVIVDVAEVLRDPGGYQNIQLRDGDVLDIPASRELVTIDQRGTNFRIAARDTLIQENRFSVAYVGPDRANRYIKEFAGGFAKRADRRSLVVRYASGQVRHTAGFLGLRFYPKVKPGSSIALSLKPAKERRPPRERVDWAAVAAAITTALTGAVTIVLLVRALDNP